MISPLLLQAQIVPPAGGGSFGLADTSLLENPFRAPMWLDEIRFRLDSGTGWSSMGVTGRFKCGTPLLRHLPLLQRLRNRIRR